MGLALDHRRPATLGAADPHTVAIRIPLRIWMLLRCENLIQAMHITSIRKKNAALVFCARRERTKPIVSGVEKLLFTAWCGRMIPKACLTHLPPLVAAARQSSDDSAWMLTDTRLW